ncbi:MAG: PIN domain-containing protein [Anaerolineae bacterium]|nr:PIN domain-containing protein [Anaerolineae bacterium]
MKRFILDTNIMSLLLRYDHSVRLRFQSTVRDEDVLIGCPLVYHEVKRGLLAKGARSQLARLQALFDGFNWQDYQLGDWDLAAQLWAQRRSIGHPINDADLFIAAFTLRRNAILVTANEKDFVDLGLPIENWENEAE